MDRDRNNIELMRLLNDLCNNQFTPAQNLQLQDLLRDDPQAQKLYLAYIDLHVDLKHVFAAEAGVAPARKFRWSRAKRLPAAAHRRGSRLGWAIGALTIACGLLFAFFVVRENSFSQQPAPEIIAITGDVRLMSGDGQSRAAAAGMTLSPDDRIVASGAGASARIAYDDGTQLTLVNDCAARCVAGRRKHVALDYGIVSAQVAPQPAGQPMLIATPGANVEVLGTRLAIVAASDRMELDVAEGRVRLTRLSDGQTVDVAQGQRVVASDHSQLAVRTSTDPRDQWTADFENGIPAGWTGSPAATELPDNARGAIQAVRQQDSEPPVYVIASRDEWVEGLFAVHGDTHLHITMKMDRPDWLNVFLASRNRDTTNPKWTLHNFNEVPFWPPRSGEWRTVTIPISKFRSKQDGVFRDVAPAVGDVVYSLSISATEPDRGLVVDRIWTTRGGPNEVQAR